VTYQDAPQAPKNGLGTTALILGIIGLLFAWIPIIGFLGLVLGVLATIFGIIGIVRAHKGTATNMVMTYIGAGLGVLSIVLSTVVFGAFVLAVDKGINEDNLPTRDLGDQNSPAQDSNGPKTVRYEVEGTGTANSISFGQDGSISQDNGAELPWKKEAGYSDFTLFTLTAQSNGGGEITCRITAEGTVIAENTSSGDYAMVSCNGTTMG